MRFSKWNLFVLVAAVALVGSVVAARCQSSYSSHRDAFDSVRWARLTQDAADWVVSQHADNWASDWVIERTRRGGIDAWGYPSPDRRFCLFVYAQYGEFGQGGDATYCMVNGEGRALWCDTSSVLAPPVVSNQGVAAMFEGEGAWGKATCVVKDSTGSELWTHTWEDITTRPLQRGWAENYAFSPDGRFFVTTMNVCTYELGIDDERSRTSEINETTVTVADLHAGKARSVQLGWLRPGGLEFDSGGTVTVSGAWGPVYSIGNPIATGSVTIDFDGHIVRKTFIRQPAE